MALQNKRKNRANWTIVRKSNPKTTVEIERGSISRMSYDSFVRKSHICTAGVPGKGPTEA